MGGACVALLLALLAETSGRIVVTTAGPLDAQRLSDALHVYLDEFGIAIDSGPAAEGQDLRQRMAAAQRLGETVRAVAVIRAEGDGRDTIEIELDDLTTHKTLIASVPKPPRDADLYRTLALKIQALLRATLSEARQTLDPRSAAGRLAAADARATMDTSRSLDGRLALEAGYQALSLTAAGAVLQGLSAVASWRVARRFDVALGTAALTTVRVSRGGVDAVAEIVPLFAAARARWGWQRVEILAGPAAEAALASVTTVSATVPVRSPRNLMFALGIEGELRVAVGGPFELFARGDAFAVLDAPSYDVGGASILDTSRLHLAGSAGLGIVFP
ncbi:MAG TPA: hypothetical protein VHM31_18020 [Polyangia bacterium]|nr:hypothetical protein [Polyangia bacterium]